MVICLNTALRQKAGLGIRSSVFRSNRSFLVIERSMGSIPHRRSESEFQRSTTAIRSRSSFFKRLTRGIRSRSIFLKDRRERFDQGRLIEISRRAIRSQSIFFKDRKIEDRKIEFPSQPKSQQAGRGKKQVLLLEKKFNGCFFPRDFFYKNIILARFFLIRFPEAALPYTVCKVISSDWWYQNVPLSITVMLVKDQT